MTALARYPARVYRGDQLVTNRGAVIVDRGRLRVAAFTADRKGVEVVLDLEGVRAVEPHISRAVIVHFDDGSTVNVSKGDGCSCSNPLRRWYNEHRGLPARSGS